MAWRTQALRDFLTQCFHKDCNLRVSAAKLLKHAWLQKPRKEPAPVTAVRPQERRPDYLLVFAIHSTLSTSIHRHLGSPSPRSARRASTRPLKRLSNGTKPCKVRVRLRCMS